MQSETEAVSSAAPCSVAISPSMAADAEEMHRVPPCFDWLRQQIESDMSPDVIVLYGLTDSVLPFGSSAVIQISSSEVENDASDDAASHFLLAQLIDRHNSLFEDQMDKNALPGKGTYSSAKTRFGDELNGDLLLHGVEPCNKFDEEQNGSQFFGSFSDGKVLASSSTNSSEKFSGLRLLALLSPPLTVNQVSKLATKDLLCKFLSGSTEDYVISSLHAFVEKKINQSAKLKFLVHCPCEMIYPNLKLSASMDWYSNFLRWWKGELSNYEYLLVLNKLAGRRWGDHTFHTVMPWVIDFSVKPDENSDIGWRDLQKSKWRLAKELAVCSYKARSCPSWASSPEDFILLHRNALESERVARQIHHWIDITFGYKLSGEPAIAAKNVMLPLSDPLVPRSMGRRQLFTRPHPMRQASKFQSGYSSSKKANTSMQRQKIEGMSYSNESSGIDSALLSSSNDFCLSESNYLENLEEAVLFCEAGRFLNPVYSYDINSIKFPEVDIPHGFHSKMDDLVMHGRSSVPCDLGLGHLLDFFESDDDDSSTFQDLMRWRYSSSSSRPLFDRISLNAYKENDVLPEAMQELPPSIVVLVEAAIQRDWKRRISARYFLESPYFSPSVRGVFVLAPLQLLSRPGYRLQYAAKLASEGALKTMGPYATEKCVPYILPLVMTALSDSEAESAMCLLKEFFKCLNSRATRKFILPIIQKILQASEYSSQRFLYFKNLFVHDLWKQLGKQAYLENIHPSVISNLCNSLDKVSVSVAAVVLIGLFVKRLAFHNNSPVVHSFGKGLSSDGIDALVRIGLAIIDGFHFLDGLGSLLPPEVFLRELIQVRNGLFTPIVYLSGLHLFEECRFILYPSLAQLMGIERLRHCCSTWFILEQILKRDYCWQWNSIGEPSRNFGGQNNAQCLNVTRISSSDYNPAKLLNGVGWSVPQSKGVQGGMAMMSL
ncbi:hypothetical protein HPP92_015254 [Vanilla planifolia]|uniref:BEACH domain-containing protein n=1 Tax=Vanilla planifolia TaxID=51239 RepID=A0A835QT73_VANPL|nr:hypothetical protein HPP92_015254 [Vanilla planifolia]